MNMDNEQIKQIYNLIRDIATNAVISDKVIDKIAEKVADKIKFNDDGNKFIVRGI